MAQYWKATVTCANCGETQACAAAQMGPQPGGDVPMGWIRVVIKERMPSVARTPRQAVAETGQARAVAYPVCCEACGVELLIGRAYALARTKNVKADLEERFKKAVEGREE